MVDRIRDTVAKGCLVVIPFVFIACAISFGIFWFFPTIKDYNVRRSLNKFEGAKKVYEDSGEGWWGNTAQTSLYYWTGEPIDVVQRYYEEFTTPFVVVEDQDGRYLVAFLNGTIDISTSVEFKTTPHPHCDFHYTYDCVTVGLVDILQADYYEFGVMSPTPFKRETIPPELESIPEYGTIIVYSYFVAR